MTTTPINQGSKGDRDPNKAPVGAAEPRERPILFSGPMVRAILSGAKTQTRRAARVPDGLSAPIVQNDATGEWGWWWTEWRWEGHGLDARQIPYDEHFCAIRSPYGKPGDLLWVRETCRAEELSRPPQTRPATRKEREALGRTSVIELDELDGSDGVRYMADDAWVKIENTRDAGERWSDLYHYRGRGKDGIGNQVPAIHMPRWASRITLRITDVRVERLRDISDDDAEAEGIYFDKIGFTAGYLGIAGRNQEWSATPGIAFANLWRAINGAESWAANPWVWAISFERVRP